MTQAVPADLVRRVERRTLFIMVGIMVFQAWGLVAMLHGWPAARIAGLFAFRSPAVSGWAVGTIVTAAYVLGSMRSLPYIRERFFDLTWLKLLAVPFSFGAGAVEELLFRRLLMNGLAHAGWSTWLQVAISGAAFGVAHSIFGAFSRSWRAVVSPVIWTTLLGLVLAVVYVVAGRDVAPCIWSHSLINLALEPWLLVAVMLRARRAAPAAAGGIGI